MILKIILFLLRYWIQGESDQNCAKPTIFSSLALDHVKFSDLTQP